MKRLASKKSHSWWWDSHISPKNSKWLSENLERMDRLIKEMLQLIEEEGDSFAKKAEMYYRRRPELISHVEDFYRMYRALAERYDIVTGELRKSVSSDLQSQGSGNSSDFCAEPASPSFSLSPDRTPERKQNLPKPSRRASGFDVFLGSTTSSDFSRKGSDSSSSSSSSESGSDSEDGKVVDAYKNTSGMNARIIQLENELREAREKLKEYEKASNVPGVHLASIDEHHDPKDKIATDAEAESGGKTVVVETVVCNHEDELKSLKEAMEAASKRFEAEISLKDHTIEEHKTQLDAAMNNFIQEKSTLGAEFKSSIADLKLEVEQRAEYKIELDAEMSKLKQEKSTIEAELKSSIADLKLEAQKFSEKISSLRNRIVVQEQMIKEMKVMSAESFERLLHEKSILESKICSLMDSVNIHASKLKALEVEADLHLESVERTVLLEAEISNHKKEIKCLKEAMEAAAKQFEAEISLKDQTIAEYKIQHDEAMNKFMQENSTHVAELKNSIAHLKLESEQLSEKKSSLQIIILKQEQMIKELEIISKASSERLLHEKSILESKVFSLMGSESIHALKIQALEARIRELDAEKTEACNASVKRIDELNQSLDASKLKIDMLTSEKDELDARVSKLIDDAKCRDNNCHSMADHLHQLHIEHVNLIKEIEEARKNSVVLMNRVRELEEDVERQRVLILDGAEGKREAIRQLCFSLEHYRDGYQKLRQMLQGNNKRNVVMAT